MYQGSYFFGAHLLMLQILYLDFANLTVIAHLSEYIYSSLNNTRENETN